MADNFREVMRSATTGPTPEHPNTRRAEAVSLATAQGRAGGGTPDTYWRGGGDYYFETTPEGIKVTGGDASTGNLAGGKSVIVGWDDPMTAAILAEQGSPDSELGVRYAPAAPPQLAQEGGQPEGEGPKPAMEATGQEAPYWAATEFPSAEFAYTGEVPELQQMFGEAAPFHPFDAEGWDTGGWTGPITNREVEAAARAGRIKTAGADEGGRIHYKYEGRSNPKVRGEEAAHMAAKATERREAMPSRASAARNAPPTKMPKGYMRPNG